MGQKEKLIQKLRSRPRDVSFDEAETLLHYMGFKFWKREGSYE